MALLRTIVALVCLIVLASAHPPHPKMVRLFPLKLAAAPGLYILMRHNAQSVLPVHA